MKVFTVIPVEWSYNDEYYYTEGFAEPKDTYVDEQQAKTAATKRTRDDLRKLITDPYTFDGYCGEEGLDLDALAKLLGITNYPDDEYASGVIQLFKGKWTDDLIDKLQKMMGVDFYVVVSTTFHK